MDIVIHSISVDNILKCKGDDVKKYLSLFNPQVYGSDILFDVAVNFSGDIHISNKQENKNQYILIQLGQQGELKLKNTDYVSIELL